MRLAERTALIALVLLIAASVRAEEPFLPTPPRQAEAWTPPATGLPRFLVSATQTLFEQGLADPRGCEYRTIRIMVGNLWGGQAQEVATTGWVLPTADAEKPRHAIAWNGLVYPLVAAGEPADLDADARALKPIDADLGPEVRRSRRVGFNSFGTNDESSAVAAGSFHLIKVCLLLRLGRADLAESIWTAAGRPLAPRSDGPGLNLDLNSYGASYLSLATDLAWYHFDRAICAHMRGDDPLALADARALDALAKAVDAKAEKMGFPRPERQQAQRGEAARYIDFLDQLPELLADQERRAKERANPPAPVQAEDRVSALIRDLDQVAARQWGQPGGVALGESQIIKDLISQGDAAVDPLIQDFRSDDRLTRSVGFHRDFFRGRTILRADQAAYTALTGILKATNFAPPALQGTDGGRISRKALADQIQAYWDKNRSIPLIERWYRTLADDKAGSAAWMEAAGSIIQPENVKTIPGGLPFVVTETTQLRPGERPRLRGESLRQGHEPTVTELMVRRIESMLKTPEGQSFELLTPNQMARMLATWDPAAAVPTLREMTRICRERYARPNNGRDWTNQNLAVSIAQFTLARAEAGDLGAIREYAEWVRTTSPDWLEDNALAALEPLLRRPEDPDLAASAAWLFGDPQSPWVPLIGRKDSRSPYRAAQLIASPLVELPAFRKLLQTALGDRSLIGTAEISDGGGVNVKFDAGGSMGRSSAKDKNDPDAPAAGANGPIRMCDFYAWQLTTLEGAPAFNPCWPEPKRDAALIAIAEFLRLKQPRS